MSACLPVHTSALHLNHTRPSTNIPNLHYFPFLILLIPLYSPFITYTLPLNPPLLTFLTASLFPSMYPLSTSSTPSLSLRHSYPLLSPASPLAVAIRRSQNPGNLAAVIQASGESPKLLQWGGPVATSSYRVNKMFPSLVK